MESCSIETLRDQSDRSVVSSSPSARNHSANETADENSPNWTYWGRQLHHSHSLSSFDFPMLAFNFLIRLTSIFASFLLTRVAISLTRDPAGNSVSISRSDRSISIGTITCPSFRRVAAGDLAAASDSSRSARSQSVS